VRSDDTVELGHPVLGHRGLLSLREALADGDVGFLREHAPGDCLRRLVRADRLQCVGRGLYVVVDPVRETPPIAIANGLFADQPHYVTTDAALAYHGPIDQPIPTIMVVLDHPRRPIDIGPAVVRPVTLGPVRLDARRRARDARRRLRGRPATREQAVVDALAEPQLMVYYGLLAEVTRPPPTMPSSE